MDKFEQLLQAIKEIAEGRDLRTGEKHDATGTQTTVYGHGADSAAAGLFTYPGVDPDVFHSIVGAEAGVVGMLPKFPSIYTDPTYFTITGIQADVGDEPSTICGAAPTAGYMKGCKLTSPFGRYRRQTREIYLDRIGSRIDLSDPSYLQLQNPLPGGQWGAMNPNLIGGTNFLVNEIAKLHVEMGFSINNLLNQQLYVGTPANNNGEAYKEMAGFDLQIAQNQIDVETGTACPSMYSDLKDFDYGLVDATNSSIIDMMTAMWRYVNSIADMSNMSPVKWVWAMRRDLFYELTDVWPCRYLTYRCQSWKDTTGIDPVGQFNSAEAIRMRDDMRNGRYLIIDGERIQVVLDNGIPEESSDDQGNLADGVFASDIYLIPLTVLGGKPVTFIEYFNHANADLATALGEGKLANTVGVTNNGAWIWVVYQTGLCVYWQWKVEPRLVLRTPQLAGKLQNVAYSPLQHTRDPFPTDGYFTNGGVTYRSNRTRYTPWSQ
jgi:hypothetical protein